MDAQLVSTKKLFGMKVVSGKKGKRIGKVRRFVFHPTQRRCIGILVKRPDAALMFHRKDLFVSLAGCEVRDGELVVKDGPNATDAGAVKALGVDWDACVIWVGMPVMTESGDFLGFVESVKFDGATGEVDSLTTENGAANDAVLGRRTVPAGMVRGFRRGKGIALAPVGDYHGEDDDQASERGAILVFDEVAGIAAEGGVAAAAGKATAVVTNKAKQGMAKTKAVVAEQAGRARPVAQRAAEKTGKAVEAGAFAAGKQLGRASGMFAAFKEEYDKASRGGK